jgi:hypothetical protein
MYSLIYYLPPAHYLAIENTEQIVLYICHRVPHTFETISNSIKSKCHCVSELTTQIIRATLLDW